MNKHLFSLRSLHHRVIFLLVVFVIQGAHLTDHFFVNKAAVCLSIPYPNFTLYPRYPTRLKSSNLEQKVLLQQRPSGRCPVSLTSSATGESSGPGLTNWLHHPSRRRRRRKKRASRASCWAKRRAPFILLGAIVIRIISLLAVRPDCGSSAARRRPTKMWSRGWGSRSWS